MLCAIGHWIAVRHLQERLDVLDEDGLRAMLPLVARVVEAVEHVEEHTQAITTLGRRGPQHASHSRDLLLDRRHDLRVHVRQTHEVRDRVVSQSVQRSKFQLGSMVRVHLAALGEIEDLRTVPR